ncbi:MAG: hypothetical protein AAF664_26140, partial [Planctomycetota bacterium]
DHLFSLRFKLGPIGEMKTCLELHDSRGNLIATRVQSGMAESVRTRGWSSKGELAIFERQANGEQQLSLLNPMTLESRISRTLPFATRGYLSTFTLDGESLALVDYGDDGFLNLFLLSTEDLTIVDEYSVQEFMIEYMGPSFAVCNNELVWYENGSFRSEPRDPTNPHLSELLSASSDALLVESVAPPSDEDAGTVRYSIDWLTTGKRLELPHRELTDPQLLEGGDLILSYVNDADATAVQIASNRQGSIVSQLPPSPSYFSINDGTKNLFREFLNENPFEGSFDRLSLWNAKTGELFSTTDFTKTHRRRFLATIGLAGVWCLAWLLPIGRQRLGFLGYGVCVAMLCMMMHAITFGHSFRYEQLASVCLGLAKLTLISFVAGWFVSSRDVIFKRTVEALVVFAITFHCMAQYDLNFSSGEKFTIPLAMVGCILFLIMVRFSIHPRSADALRDASATCSSRRIGIPSFRVSDLIWLIAATALLMPWLPDMSVLASGDYWSQRGGARFLGETTSLFLQATIGLLIVFGTKWQRVLGVAMLIAVVAAALLHDDFRRRVAPLDQASMIVFAMYLALLGCVVLVMSRRKAPSLAGLTRRIKAGRRGSSPEGVS